MKIAILSHATDSYSNRRLSEAADSAGHTAEILTPFRFRLHIDNHKNLIYYDGRSAENFDLIIPRFGPKTVKFGIEVLRHFEALKIPVLNRSAPILAARNKFQTARILAENGIPILPTFTLGAIDFLHRSIEKIGGYPVVMKPFEGTHGIGIMKISEAETARSIVSTMCELHRDYLMQTVVEASSDYDMRVIVVRNSAVAAMTRTPTSREFRANVHRGAIGKPIELNEKLRNLSVSATNALGLEVAGVDLLRTKSGYVISEVNPSPGFEEIEAVTKMPVAEEIISQGPI